MMINEKEYNRKFREQSAKCYHPRVRETVAQDPSTPLELLKSLAEDPDWYVRDAVALNPNASEDLLVKLTDDYDPCVCLDAAENLRSRGHLTPEVKEKIETLLDKFIGVEWITSRIREFIKAS